MSEKELRAYFADVQIGLCVKLGLFCDRNYIYRSDFTNFMKGKKYYTSLEDLNMMAKDIMDHVISFSDLYHEIFE